MRSVLNIVAGILLGMLLAGGIFLVVRAPQGESVQLRPPPTEEPLQVHVTGAVVRPGVYDLPVGARVLDAVEAAGGFVAEADKNALNLAARLEDADKLDIPFVAGFEPEEEQGFVVVTEGTPSSLLGEDLVDINEANQDELEELPGIGPSLAERIIEYREENGPFDSIEDIVNVSGIGSATYDEIKDLITVGE
jgi:competence protein ComEA